MLKKTTKKKPKSEITRKPLFTDLNSGILPYRVIKETDNIHKTKENA